MLLTAQVLVDGYDDGLPGIVAICDDHPDLVGHGATDDEALQDWIEQFERLVIH